MPINGFGHQVGTVKIIKCKICENKENGIQLEEVYKKYVEISKCKIKDNFYNGVCISQDLEPEEDLR